LPELTNGEFHLIVLEEIGFKVSEKTGFSVSIASDEVNGVIDCSKLSKQLCMLSSDA
jgi:hypothetical protein